MRVYQFITIFLALGIACGCSHRRAQQQPVAATLCDCAACRYEQERLISADAVPAEHFGNSIPATTLPTNEPELMAPTVAAPETVQPVVVEPSELSPEYTTDSSNADEKKSPFSSGNPIDIDEAPQQFNAPAVDGVKPLQDQIPNGTLKFAPEPGSLPPLGQHPAQDSSDNSFKPFSRDLFKVKSETSPKVPLEQQPSILIDKVEPQASTFEAVSNIATPDFASNTRNFVPEISQPTETVVEGQLYEDPVVLYARPRRRQLIASPVQTPKAVQPASVQKPVEQVDHQGIAQHSQLDPVYGLPLSNQVNFNSLPAIADPQSAPTPVEAQHLHVHIHHDYSNNAGVVQGPVAYQNGQPAANVQVVYRDDKGRVIMAPPTPAMGVPAVVPTGDQRTYYIPPKQILRLKAVSPIGQSRSNPSVASIQMRDTVVYGGNHLLTKPEYQAQAVQTNHGLPGIDHEKLREAFKTSPRDSSLR